MERLRKMEPLTEIFTRSLIWRLDEANSFEILNLVIFIRFGLSIAVGRFQIGVG